MVTKRTAKQKRLHPVLSVCGKKVEKEKVSVCVCVREETWDEIWLNAKMFPKL